MMSVLRSGRVAVFRSPLLRMRLVIVRRSGGCAVCSHAMGRIWLGRILVVSWNRGAGGLIVASAPGVLTPAAAATRCPPSPVVSVGRRRLPIPGMAARGGRRWRRRSVAVAGHGFCPGPSPLYRSRTLVCGYKIRIKRSATAFGAL